MWDILKWQNDTLSVAWWALVAFAVLVIRGGEPGRKEVGSPSYSESAA